MSNLQQSEEEAIQLGNRILVGLGTIFLLWLVGLTIVGVGARYLFGNPIFGLEDLAKLTLAGVVSTGLALAAISRTHIAVDMFVTKLPELHRKWISLFVSAAGIAMSVIAVYALLLKSSCGRACGEFTANLSLPHAPVYWTLAAAFCLYAVVLVVDIAIILKAKNVRS